MTSIGNIIFNIRFWDVLVLYSFIANKNSVYTIYHHYIQDFKILTWQQLHEIESTIRIYFIYKPLFTDENDPDSKLGLIVSKIIESTNGRNQI